MLMTLTLTDPDAVWPSTGDLGFLLGKHPDRHQTVSTAAGTAHVFFPEHSRAQTTAALYLDVDPVKLSRKLEPTAPLMPYVNDRPYVTGSLFATAIVRAFRTAMKPENRDRDAMAKAALALRIGLPSVRAPHERVIRGLFAPLGYTCTITSIPLDAPFASTAPGAGPLFSVILETKARLCDVLTQLYVLLPALDGEKHFWVNKDEADKLVRMGGTWLATHPERERILMRSLNRQRSLVDKVNAGLDALLPPAADTADGEAGAEGADSPAGAEVPGTAEARVPLNALRMDTVVDTLRGLGARRVADLGCGDGKLLQRLLRAPDFTHVFGADVSSVALSRAEQRLKLDRASPRDLGRLTLVQGSLVYRDARFEGFDAVALVEVIEHMDPHRLPVMEDVVFVGAKPSHVVVTTPNRAYNAVYAKRSLQGMAARALQDAAEAAGEPWTPLSEAERAALPVDPDALAKAAARMRHGDHRFEWTRAEFTAWADGVCARTGYTVRIEGIGEDDPDCGQPTQMAIFSRAPDAGRPVRASAAG